jgi:hypothetical protein
MLETRKFVIQETPYFVALRGRTFAFADGHGLGLAPFCGWDSGWVEVLGVLQLNVCAKRFVQHFTGFSLSTRAVGHGLFYADDLMALRALAEAMTRAIHFVLWPKPSHVGQFWLFHAPSFPQARRFGYTAQIILTHYRIVCPGIS